MQMTFFCRPRNDADLSIMLVFSSIWCKNGVLTSMIQKLYISETSVNRNQISNFLWGPAA